MNRNQLIALVELSQTDEWSRGYAVAALEARLAEAADWRERQMIGLALRHMG